MTHCIRSTTYEFRIVSYSVYLFLLQAPSFAIDVVLLSRCDLLYPTRNVRPID